MSALLIFVALYLLASIAIGLYAATRVRDTGDYVVAGRKLPFFMVFTMVFATWFGAETVLGIPARFVEEGLGGILEDPFGASMCLVLFGLFFVRKLYRMNLLTIGDYYRVRYNGKVEFIVSVCIVISYLGWVAAQITALGLVLNLLTQGAITVQWGMLISASIVLLYTVYGGMWSVAFTDMFQMTIIVVGLCYITWLVADMAGGAEHVITHAAQAGKFNFLPAFTSADVLAFVAAWVTMMFGSIPQQDVFQRAMSAKSAKIGKWASVCGGSFYFLFAFVPIFLAYAAFLIDPEMVERMLAIDPQRILPTLIMNDMPVFAQVMFFGALLSALMSTASATLLAPSITLTENLIKPRFPMNDLQQLRMTRIVVAGFTLAVTVFALLSEGTSIYEMVGNAYKVTLVGAFVPLVVGLYWSRATTQGALFSSIGGLLTWVLMETFGEGSIWPPQLLGLVVSFVGIFVGSLLPSFIGKRAAAA